jgi:hypothetical protein
MLPEFTFGSNSCNVELIVSFNLTSGAYMQKGDYITAILRSSKTVFTTKDIALMWHEPSSNATRVRLNYYFRKG